MKQEIAGHLEAILDVWGKYVERQEALEDDEVNNARQQAEATRQAREAKEQNEALQKQVEDLRAQLAAAQGSTGESISN